MQIGIRTVILIIVGVIGTLAIMYSYDYSVPDLVEARYGFPLTWGVNTLNTLAGPVNTWRVDLIKLTVDVALWFAVLIGVSSVLNYRRKLKGT